MTNLKHLPFLVPLWLCGEMSLLVGVCGLEARTTNSLTTNSRTTNSRTTGSRTTGSRTTGSRITGSRTAAGSSSVHAGQVAPEGWVGFADAGGVVDDNVGPAEADERQAHGHAVVVVGFKENRRCVG